MRVFVSLVFLALSLPFAGYVPKPRKKRRCCKINTNDNIVERKFNQVTTDRQWRKHMKELLKG